MSVAESGKWSEVFRGWSLSGDEEENLCNMWDGHRMWSMVDNESCASLS